MFPSLTCFSLGQLWVFVCRDRRSFLCLIHASYLMSGVCILQLLPFFCPQSLHSWDSQNVLCRGCCQKRKHRTHSLLFVTGCQTFNTNHPYLFSPASLHLYSHPLLLLPPPHSLFFPAFSPHFAHSCYRGKPCLAHHFVSVCIALFLWWNKGQLSRTENAPAPLSAATELTLFLVDLLDVSEQETGVCGLWCVAVSAAGCVDHPSHWCLVLVYTFGNQPWLGNNKVEAVDVMNNWWRHGSYALSATCYSGLFHMELQCCSAG